MFRERKATHLKEQNKKPKAVFNILSSDSTDGDGGYGVGTIDLNNVTPIIIDPEENKIFVDMEALHGRSVVEKKVRFRPDKTHAGDEPKLYWIVWVSLNSTKTGPYYSGCAACEVLVSREERRIKLGYKSMPEHVNNLDKAIKGKFVLSHMDEKSKNLLRHFLINHDEGFWNRSIEELKSQLTV
ncbi:YwhD family protein [Bacillus pseudomycoides]|uniref:YwhD family protein n=1 Tax=Bacillus pseudomycoides TaxID=64104 RepID=UPI0001A14A23|nr:hypothetical protein bmyco0002_52310 [Bacillus pseudomycoides]PGC34228.1 hypothetical protein COM18_24640 [Bacillus pseudomycoides]